ncbi:MAG: cyanate transporter, major facilitator family protein, partial [Herminiimonas sp.]|nr:cyanate transporter, major facilitator family protein [Herminiimonas sp.]
MQKNDALIDAEANDRDDEPAIHEPPPQASRVLLIVALFLVGMNLRPALSSLAPLLAAVRSGTGMSSATAGLLTTLPVLCFGLFAPLAPRLARRISSERIILYGLLMLAAGIGLRIFFGIAGLFAGTLLAGASISIVMVLLPGIIKRDFPDRPGLMTGVYTMALCLGAALAAGITVPIQNLAGGDWRPALAFWLLPALIAAAMWRPQLRHGVQHHGQARYAVRGLWSGKLAWQATIYMGAQSALAYCVFGWLPTILIDRGLPPLTAGFVLSISITLQIFTALGGPWLATRGRDQRLAIVLLMCMTLAGLLGCLYAPVDAIWPWAIILGLGQGGSFSIGLTLIVLRAPNAHVAASLSGMMQGFGYSMAALGPFAVGVLHDVSHAWNTVAIFFTAVSIVAIVAGIGAG